MAIGLRPGVTRDRLDEAGRFDDPLVDEVLRGAIDLHVHPGPSPLPRRMGVLEAASDAARYGYRAIVAKSHHHSMLSEIQALRDEAGLADVPVDVFGGVALNHQVGGLNPHAVELALALGGRVVWFPTIASDAHLCHHEEVGFPAAGLSLRHGPPIPIADDRGRRLPEVTDILQQIAAAGAVLNTGHLGVAEIDMLLEEARAAGVERVVVSHPDFIVGADPERVRRWAEAGAYVEFCCGLYDEAGGLRATDLKLGDLVRYLSAVPEGRVVLASDVGQRTSPRPVDTMRRTLRDLLDEGFTTETLRRYVVDNPAAVLYGEGLARGGAR